MKPRYGPAQEAEAAMAGNEVIDYAAVLADLEGRRAQLDAAIASVKAILGQTTEGGAPTPGPGGGAPKPGEYLGMSIADATKKHLTTVRGKVGTKALMDALEAGGLPKLNYATVYSVLRRRERQVKDIINIDGDWGLAAWYQNFPRSKPPPSKSEARTKKRKKDSKKSEGGGGNHKASEQHTENTDQKAAS